MDNGSCRPADTAEVFQHETDKALSVLASALNLAKSTEADLKSWSGQWEKKSRGEAVSELTRHAKNILIISKSLGILSRRMEKRVRGLDSASAYAQDPPDPDIEVLPQDANSSGEPKDAKDQSFDEPAAESSSAEESAGERSSGGKKAKKSKSKSKTSKDEDSDDSDKEDEEYQRLLAAAKTNMEPTASKSNASKESEDSAASTSKAEKEKAEEKVEEEEIVELETGEEEDAQIKEELQPQLPESPQFAQDATEILGGSLSSDEDDIFTARAKARARADSDSLPDPAKEEAEDDDDDGEGPSRLHLPKVARIASSSSSDDDDEAKKGSSMAKSKKGKKRKIRSSDEDELYKEMTESESQEEEEEVLSVSSDSDIIIEGEKSGAEKAAEAKKLRGKGKASAQPKKAKRQRRAKVADEESEEEEETEKKKTPSPSKRKGAKKVMSEKDLAESTKEAKKREDERVKRLKERQASFNGLVEAGGGLDGLTGPVYKEVVLDKSEEHRVAVDPALVGVMKKHQGQGIQFMFDNLFESVAEYAKGEGGSGCILAHCMGLGKTFQCVTFIHTVMTNKAFAEGVGKGGPIKRTLVLAPVNAILTWDRELTNWLEKAEMHINHTVLQTSSMAERADILRHWHKEGGVLICGYPMLRTLRGFVEKPKSVKGVGKKAAAALAQAVDEALFDPGPEMVIADEGHKLKNDKARITQCVEKINTKRRVCLTGTPIQNHLEEYYTMVSWAKPGLLGTKKEFKNRFENPIKAGQYLDSPSRAVKVMKQRSFVLNKTLGKAVMRRDYTELVPYLPPKHEYIIYIRLTAKQAQLYRLFIRKAVGETDAESLKGRKILPDFHNFSRIWLHPYALVKHQADVEAKRDRLEELDEMADFVVDEDEESDDSGAARRRRGKKGAKAVSSDSAEEEVMPGPSTVPAGGGRRTRANPNAPDREMTPEEIQGWWGDAISAEDEEDLSHSSKLLLLLDMLRKCEECGDKLLVFSQSLMSLDIIEKFLDTMKATWWSEDHEAVAKPIGSREEWSWERGRDYYRLDGSVPAETRKKLQEAFNDPRNPRARLFLISTLAGSLGIDLIGANRVVVFDCCWNPSHDTQSIFRVYRFGQKKPVYIYRFVTEAAMEEVIFRRQVTKQSIQLRVCDDQQIQRHFQQTDVEELYRFDYVAPPESDEDRSKHVGSLTMPKKDKLLCDLILDRGQYIGRLGTHDSLLEHKADEELSQEEQAEAWRNYEAERDGRGWGGGAAASADPPWFALVRPSLDLAVGPEATRSFFLSCTNWIQYGNYALTQLDRSVSGGISDLSISFYSLLEKELSLRSIHKAYLDLRKIVMALLLPIYRKDHPQLTLEMLEVYMRGRVKEWQIPSEAMSEMNRTAPSIPPQATATVQRQRESEPNPVLQSLSAQNPSRETIRHSGKS